MVAATRRTQGGTLKIAITALLCGVSTDFFKTLETGKAAVKFDNALGVARHFGIELVIASNPDACQLHGWVGGQMAADLRYEYGAFPSITALRGNTLIKHLRFCRTSLSASAPIPKPTSIGVHKKKLPL